LNKISARVASLTGSSKTSAETSNQDSLDREINDVNYKTPLVSVKASQIDPAIGIEGNADGAAGDGLVRTDVRDGTTNTGNLGIPKSGVITGHSYMDSDDDGYKTPDSQPPHDRFAYLESNIERQLDKMSNAVSTKLGSTANTENGHTRAIVSPPVPKHDLSLGGTYGYRDYDNDSLSYDRHSIGVPDVSLDDDGFDSNQGILRKSSIGPTTGGIGKQKVLPVMQGFENFSGFGVKCVAQDIKNRSASHQM
jgi:hypothetical protein